MRNFGVILLFGLPIVLAVFYFYVIQDNVSNATIEGRLFIADTQSIQKLNIENLTLDVSYDSLLTPQEFWIGGLDCSYELDGIYYSDMKNSKLYALEKKSSEPRVVFSGYENWYPICLAVEDITNKLYVGDLIQGGLTVHDMKTGYSSVIFGAGILLCAAVAVDVEEKYIFIVDKYQILRLDLDGKNPQTIYELSDKSNLEYSKRRFRNGPQKNRLYTGVDGMTLDRRHKRVYWSRGQVKKIESSDYKGHDRKVHFQATNTYGNGRSSSNSLAIVYNSIYWADPIGRNIVKIKSSVEYEVLQWGFEHATIASCEQRLVNISNPCKVDNGGCQQLCLLSRSNSMGYSCNCKFGYEIDTDGKSCRRVREFLLFLEGGVIKGLSLSDNPTFVFQPPGIKASDNSFIDFDTELGSIYYTDKLDNNEIKLHERRIKGNEKPKILTPHLFSRQVANFAYDWTTKNLYYLSQYYSDMMSLSVTNIRDPTYAKILVKNLFDDSTSMRFFGPVVHPNEGYLFLITIGGKSNRGEIKRMAMDGSDVKVIYKVGERNSLGGITVDFGEDRIYWGEVRESGSIFWQSSIKNSNLNGEDIRGFDLTRDIEMPIGLTTHHDYIYGIDVGKRLFRMNKDGRDIRILVESGHLAYNLKIYSRDLQVTREDHPCKNHKCQKFCFALPNDFDNLKAICGCPYGQKLASDGVSCVDNSKDEPAFKICDNRNFCKMEY